VTAAYDAAREQFQRHPEGYTMAEHITAAVQNVMNEDQHAYDGMLGIEAPVATGDGHFAHETGSGRLRWDIHPDGNVRLEIWRPGRLSATLTAEVSWPPLLEERTWEPEGPAIPDREPLVLLSQWGDAHSRHLTALMEAIRAIQGWRTHSDGALTALFSPQEVADPTPVPQPIFSAASELAQEVF
jgi:hypothetical protein